MDLKKYFEERHGLGIMSAASRDGKVFSAVYSRPHILDDGSVAFIMRDKMIHHCLQENPFATYLFKEDTPGYIGVRLYLKKVREDSDPELIATMKRRFLTKEEDEARGPKYIVYFAVEKKLALIGDTEL